MIIIRYITTKCHRAIKKSFSDKYLVYTNVGISVFLSGLGDIIEQNYEMFAHGQDKWDKVRTKNMSLSGMTIGVICHYWYQFLDKRFPGYTLRIVLKKVLLDQFICSPITISALFITVGTLERQSRQEIFNEIKQKALILYTAEWVVWPPAQFINFYLLPTRFRVLYDNTISLGYDIYTSYVKNVIPVEKDREKS